MDSAIPQLMGYVLTAVMGLVVVRVHHAQTVIAILLIIFVPVVSAVHVTLDLTVSVDIAIVAAIHALTAATDPDVRRTENALMDIVTDGIKSALTVPMGLGVFRLQIVRMVIATH